MSAGIDLENVVCDFGDFRAVDHVTVSIKPGEFFSFLGPSGCGKTTILRMISGFTEPTQGVIRIGGMAALHQHAQASHGGQRVTSTDKAVRPRHLDPVLLHGCRTGARRVWRGAAHAGRRRAGRGRLLRAAAGCHPGQCRTRQAGQQLPAAKARPCVVRRVVAHALRSPLMLLFLLSFSLAAVGAAAASALLPACCCRRCCSCSPILWLLLPALGETKPGKMADSHIEALTA